MWKDPIVEEVRKVRQDHAAKFNHDFKAIYDDLKAAEKLGNRKAVSLPPKRLKKEKKRLSFLPPVNSQVQGDIGQFPYLCREQLASDGCLL